MEKLQCTMATHITRNKQLQSISIGVAQKKHVKMSHNLENQKRNCHRKKVLIFITATPANVERKKQWIKIKEELDVQTNCGDSYRNIWNLRWLIELLNRHQQSSIRIIHSTLSCNVLRNLVYIYCNRAKQKKPILQWLICWVKKRILSTWKSRSLDRKLITKTYPNTI